MHELSIAESLIAIASAEAARQGAVAVQALHVRVGVLSGVVPDALRFAFDVAAQQTPLDGAALEIEVTPGRELELSAMEVIDAGEDR